MHAGICRRERARDDARTLGLLCGRKRQRVDGPAPSGPGNWGLAVTAHQQDRRAMRRNGQTIPGDATPSSRFRPSASTPAYSFLYTVAGSKRRSAV